MQQKGKRTGLFNIAEVNRSQPIIFKRQLKRLYSILKLTSEKEYTTSKKASKKSLRRVYDQNY